ncbi:MAG: glucosaminidase domain-containing protein [Bacteroidota bacterium]
MRSYEDFTPAKIKATFEEYWNRFEDWIKRRWIGLALLLLVGWLVTHKDISVNFSMQKGEGGFITASTSSLFYDPFEDDEVQAQNVSMSSDDRMDDLTPEQREKRRRQMAYVREYHDLAEQEMERHGIPVSITLAQGLLESNIGQSRLALENNNHFGIKCFSKSCKKGHCTNFNDDHHKDFFRKFISVEESYEAHSKVLEKDRYRSLFRLKSNDYKGWARGLRKAGYATDPRYADKLIRIIEDLELYQYDI